jgi:hypothetical protein
MARIALVVMEPGSEWPGHVGDAETLVALRSLDGTLLESTRMRLASLRLGRDDVRVAVLACSASTDARAHDERAQIADELLGSVLEARRGRLVLTAPMRGAPPLLRQQLIGLAGVLSERLRGTSTTLTLKLSDGRVHGRSVSWEPLR